MFGEIAAVTFIFVVSAVGIGHLLDKHIEKVRAQRARAMVIQRALEQFVKDFEDGMMYEGQIQPGCEAIEDCYRQAKAALDYEVFWIGDRPSSRDSHCQSGASYIGH